MVGPLVQSDDDGYRPIEKDGDGIQPLKPVYKSNFELKEKKALFEARSIRSFLMLMAPTVTLKIQHLDQLQSGAVVEQGFNFWIVSVGDIL
jgi:hypothetical protein